MNLHWKDIPCPCPWCRLAGQQDSLHRVRRMWADNKPPSPEAQALMDQIIRDALEEYRRSDNS